jgi:hypothetical protein
MKKRGISPIVATILIVLFASIAVFVVSSFLVPFVENNLSDSTECLDYNSYFEFYEDFEPKLNCVKSGEDLYFVSVSAKNIEGLNNSIGGLNLVYRGNSDFVREVINGDNVENFKMFEDTNGDCPINYEIPLSGEVRTYVLKNAENFEEVEVYPVLENGKACDMSDKIKFVECSSSVATSCL